MNFKDNIGKTLQIKHVFWGKIRTVEVQEVFTILNSQVAKIRFCDNNLIRTEKSDEWKFIGEIENLFGNNILIRSGENE